MAPITFYLNQCTKGDYTVGLLTRSPILDFASICSGIVERFLSEMFAGLDEGNRVCYPDELVHCDIYFADLFMKLMNN